MDDNMIACVTIVKDGKPKYRIKRDKYSNTYYLFTLKGDKETQTKRKANNPLELEKYCK
jgi:hypothetical protein